MRRTVEMKDYLGELQSNIEEFEAQIKVNESGIEENNKKIEELTDYSAGLSERLKTVSSEMASLQKQYEAKRQERQQLLLNKKPCESVNKEIAELKEKLEIKEDELIPVQKGIEESNNAIESLKVGSKNLETFNSELSEKIKNVKFCIDYNNAAKPLADLLKNVIEMKQICMHPAAYSRNNDFKDIDLPFMFVKSNHPEFYKEVQSSFSIDESGNDKPILQKRPFNISLF